MIFTILATLLILGIAFFQITQGLFSSLIMTVLTLLCAMFAFGCYEPLAGLTLPFLDRSLYASQPACAEATSMLALFVLPLLGLRILADRFIPGNVVMSVWADRICGGALGLITGMIMVGMVAIIIQMLPAGTNILGYEAFDSKLQRTQHIAPFYPDDFTLALMSGLSSGSMSGDSESAFALRHDSLLKELFATRSTAGQHGRVDTPPDTLKVMGAYAPKDDDLAAAKITDVPGYPSGGLHPTRVVIIRAEVDDKTLDADNCWRLPASHFRLVCIKGENQDIERITSYYPVGYLTYGEVSAAQLQAPAGTQPASSPATQPAAFWELHCADKDKKPLDPLAIFVSRSGGTTVKSLAVDWVYCIDADEHPDYIAFRRTALQPINPATQGMPETPGALTRKVP